jgi:hypothetical protein
MMDEVKQAPDGMIVGRPTLMAIYDSKLEAKGLLDRLRGVGYPLEDVSVYYRVKGSDQVLDATTGEVAAGQSLAQTEITPKMLESLDTIVLLHPDEANAQSLQQMLKSLGNADIKYEGGSISEGHQDPPDLHHPPATN